jgi:hypothetical protein
MFILSVILIFIFSAIWAQHIFVLSVYLNIIVFPVKNVHVVISSRLIDAEPSTSDSHYQFFFPLFFLFDIRTSHRFVISQHHIMMVKESARRVIGVIPSTLEAECSK